MKEEKESGGRDPESSRTHKGDYNERKKGLEAKEGARQ